MNFSANLLGRVWSATSVYLFLPAYLYVLGREAFGLVAFFATMNVAITVLVSGWTRALRFEFSRPDDGLFDRVRKYQLLRSYEVACWAVAILVITTGAITAPLITRYLLTFDALGAADVTAVIRLMFCCVAAQLVASAFASCLHGLLLQVRATVSEAAWSTGRALAAFLVGLNSDGNVVFFFAAFLAADVCYAFALRAQALSALGRASRRGWSPRKLGNLRVLVTMSLGVSVTSIVYFFNTQVDRLVIGKVLGLGDLGTYNLATALAQVPIVLTTAIAVTAFPLFVRVLHNDGRAALARQVDRVNRPATWTVALIAGHLSAFAPSIIAVWLRDAELGVELAWVAFGLIGGSAMLAVQQLTYEALLAQSITRVNVILSLGMLPFSLSVTPLLVIRYGLEGGAFAWLALMTLSTCCYLGYSHWKFFGFPLVKTLGSGLAVPFAFAYAWATVASYAAGVLAGGHVAQILLGVGSGIASLAAVGPLLLKRDRILHAKG